MGSKYTALGNLIESAPVVKAGEDEYPILSMTMKDGLVPQGEKFKKRIASSDTSSYKVVSQGQLVVGFPIDEGVLSFQDLHPQAIVSPAYAVWDLREGAAVVRAYLEKFLRSPQALAYYRSNLRGSTARRRTLSRESFLGLPVYLPSEAVQLRVIDALNQVDALRKARRRSLLLLDELAESIFFDMFGVPLGGAGQWENVRFGDILERIDSGKSPKCLDRPVLGKEWGVLKLGAVTQCVYKPEENKAMRSDIEVDLRHEVKVGDLLFTRKNTPELVAACVLVEETPPGLLMPDLIFRLIPHEKAPLEKSYLQALLSNPVKRKRIQALAGGSSGSMSNISKKKLMEVGIELPPLSLQKEFSERIKSVRCLKKKHEVHLAHLDELFASVQQRAFRGDLWESSAA